MRQNQLSLLFSILLLSFPLLFGCSDSSNRVITGNDQAASDAMEAEAAAQEYRGEERGNGGVRASNDSP